MIKVTKFQIKGNSTISVKILSSVYIPFLKVSVLLDLCSSCSKNFKKAIWE